MHSVEARVEVLAAQLRRLRLALLTLLLSILAILCAAVKQSDSPEVEAKRLIFRDDAGAVRMEIKRDQKTGAFGIYFTNSFGEDAGGLRLDADDGLRLCIRESSNVRKMRATAKFATFTQALRRAQKSGVKQAETTVLEEAVKKSAADAENASDLTTTISNGGIVFMTLHPELSTSGLFDDGLLVKSIAVSNNGGASLSDLKPGCITIYDGNLSVRTRSDGKTAVLGRASLESATGVKTEMPVSSLVLLDKDGKVLFRAPGE